MNPSLAQRYSTKAARLVDDNVTRVSSTLTQVGHQFAQTGGNGEAQNQLGPIVARQIDKMNGKLTQVRGDDVIEAAKEQISNHPTALTIVGALTGAALVRLAIIAVKKEQNTIESSNRTPNDGDSIAVDSPILSDAP